MVYSRVTIEYMDGVVKFLDYTFENNSKDGKLLCPCKSYVFYYRKNQANIHDDLVVNSIMPGYGAWIYYGQLMSTSLSFQDGHREREAHEGDDVVGMLNDTFEVWSKASDMNARNLVEMDLPQKIQSTLI